VPSCSARPHWRHPLCSPPLADDAAKALNDRRIATVADDFANGHEQASGFPLVFEDAAAPL